MDSPIPEQKIFNIPTGRGGRAAPSEGLKAMKANSYLLFPEKPEIIRDHAKACGCPFCMEYYEEAEAIDEKRDAQEDEVREALFERQQIREGKKLG